MDNPRENDPIDVRRAASLIGGLSLDLARALRSGVPAALRASLPEMPPEHAERVAAAIFSEIHDRYRVSVAARLIAIDALLRE